MNAVVELRRCRTCGTPLKPRLVKGRTRVFCTECRVARQAASMRAYYFRNRDKVVAQQREYRSRKRHGNAITTVLRALKWLKRKS